MRNLFYELPSDILDIIYKMVHVEKSKGFLRQVYINGRSWRLRFFSTSTKTEFFKRTQYTSSIKPEVELLWEFWFWLREHTSRERGPYPIPPCITNPYYSLWVSNNPWYADSLRYQMN